MVLLLFHKILIYKIYFCTGQGNETTCYDDLGCFPMNDPWVSLIRPFPSPYPPEDVDTGITLYTRLVVTALRFI